MFFESTSARENFVVHFGKSPGSDFGIWARGYAAAAHRLVQLLLSRPHFRDYEAYPAVFLYRHALELYLKATGLQGTRLSTPHARKCVYDKILRDHNLPRLLDVAIRVLERIFPDDASLAPLVTDLKLIVRDFNSIDALSIAFRYPTTKAGKRPVEKPITVNLSALAETMDEVLEQLDTVDFAVGAQIDQAEEILDMLGDRERS